MASARWLVVDQELEHVALDELVAAVVGLRGPVASDDVESGPLEASGGAAEPAGAVEQHRSPVHAHRYSPFLVTQSKSACPRGVR